YALVGNHDGPVYQDRMLHHGIYQLLIRQAGIAQVEFIVGGAFLAQECSRWYSHTCDQLDQTLPRRRRLEIFDDFRRFARSHDHRQCIARGATLRVVIDLNLHACELFSGYPVETAMGDSHSSGWPAQQSRTMNEMVFFI